MQLIKVTKDVWTSSTRSPDTWAKKKKTREKVEPQTTQCHIFSRKGIHLVPSDWPPCSAVVRSSMSVYHSCLVATGERVKGLKKIKK